MYKPQKKAESQRPAMAILDRQELKSGQVLTGTHETLTIKSAVFYNTDLIINCQDVSGKYHKDSFFVKNKRGDGWSYKMRAFLAALLPDIECQQLLLVEDRAYIERAFVGLKFSATIICDEGYCIATDGLEYFAINARTNEKLSKEFHKITDVREWALQEGLSQAYPKIDRLDAYKFISYNTELFKHGIYTAKKR